MPPTHFEDTIELIAPHVSDNPDAHLTREKGDTSLVPAPSTIPRSSFLSGPTTWRVLAVLILGLCGWLTIPASHSQPTKPTAASAAPSFKPVVRRIADYRVGYAVLSDSEHGDNDTEFGDHVDAPTWRHWILKASKTVAIELQRP